MNSASDRADAKPGPMLLEPQFHERIWGGRRLEEVLGMPLPADKPIGESWSMGSENKVLSGPHAGMTLQEAVATDPAAMLGPLVLAGGREDLPLLFKILDCEDWLSIQVHPTDDEAEQLEQQHFGKTEAWYIISAEPGARIIHGFKEPMDADGLKGAVANNTIAEHLRYLELQQGDAIFTPAGLIHALGGGLLLGEIQENSDITYRLYDWDRRDAEGKPRQLHVEKSADVTLYEPPDFGKNTPLTVHDGDNWIRYLIACRYFAYQLLSVKGALGLDTRGRSFHGVYVVEGTATLFSGDERIELHKGQTVFIPAAAAIYRIEGHDIQLLRWFVPDLEADVVEPLLAADFSREEITQLGGGTRGNDLADPAL